MIEQIIHNEYLSFFKKNELNDDDYNKINLTLIELLSSPYLKEDYPEVLSYFDDNKIFLHRHEKKIDGKNGNNMIFPDSIGFNSSNPHSAVNILCSNESELKWITNIANNITSNEHNKAHELAKESLKRLEYFIRDKENDTINNGLYLLKDNSHGNIKRKFNLTDDVNIDNFINEKITSFLNEILQPIENIIKHSEKANTIKDEEFHNFKTHLIENLDLHYLNQKPEETIIKYEVFDINNQDEHDAYNDWVSKKTSLNINESPWKQQSEKGLFYLSQISPQNGHNKKYMVIAHNDKEVIGVTQINDLNHANNEKEKDSLAFKMPYIGIQEKFRGKGIASQLFSKVLEIVEKNDKFLIRTPPSEMGSAYTQSKFTEMGKTLKNGILINSEEIQLYETFKEQVGNSNISLESKKDIYKILKEEFYKKLRTDRNFHFDDAKDIFQDSNVISRIQKEVFNNTTKNRTNRP